ncbi:hypothetical protein GCM10011376_13880 [Nocardioides flavus (ex Wang et al. 2016)]|uniref:Peptidase M15C domain-containing protein n=1 Tax=Nocardioides flavus (ex Wang et al. 2016) TaxID=2058780 RepID=A0ABQ3HGM4_9ACTN|nr:M15 family metallopeptidase [Nocardioides flavus (ex Wang et al. 2016)]GHE16778.1 hypothetical protein GCM10011376_13880 [Nocardioides flavus (ex Wang et al. 2016)]
MTFGVLALAVVTLGACSAGEEASQQGRPRPESDATALGLGEGRSSQSDADTVVTKIPHSQWRRIVAAGMSRRGCPLTRRDLRRVEVNHHRFDGTVGRGTLVVHRDVARSVADIFTRLYEAEFPIRKMRPVESYGGDANASLADDNTSAYNCRRADQINAPAMKSPHANGRAIDINPRENPWRDLRCNCWFPTAETAPREPGQGVILKGGLVWRLFTRRGWVWQNIDVPDYMHFDTGYPSGPYREPDGVNR